MERYAIIRDFIKEHKWRYIGGIIFILAVDTLQLVSPKIFGYLTDHLQKGNVTAQTLILYISTILGISFGIMVFRYLFRIYIFGTEKRLEYTLRKKLFNHLLTLSARFYNTHKTGDLMAHATNDINAVRMAMGMGVLLVTDTIFLTLSMLIIMLVTIDIKLTLMALIPLPVIALFGIRFGKVIHNRFTAVQESFSNLTDKVQETLSGIRVVKAFVQEKAELENFNKASRDMFEKNMRLARLWGIAFPFVQLIATASFIIAVGFGGIQVMVGEISLGDFVAFNTYLGMLIWPMMAFGWVINLLQRGTASLDRLQKILSQQPEIFDNDPDNIENIKGHIQFKNVSFYYTDSKNPILRNINIDLPPGKTLAIMGGTGSGKTSLISLIPRIYDAQDGEILIDGYPIDRIPLEVLRKNIGYVPQDVFLFSTTIGENISFGVEDASNEKIEEVAKIAQVYDNIMEFPKGFETVVGERGVTLSGGQKQRVSIARALITNPKILILDDALSAVDTETEEKILQGLKKIMKDRTCIIISHRVSTVKDADEIIVLEDGKIIERGNHISLLEQKGYYASLYQKQLLEQEISNA